MKILNIFFLLLILLSCAKEEVTEENQTVITSPITVDSECNNYSQQKVSELFLTPEGYDFIEQTLPIIEKEVSPKLQIIPQIKTYAKVSEIKSLKYSFSYEKLPLCKNSITITQYQNNITLSGNKPGKILQTSNNEMPKENYIRNSIDKYFKQSTQVTLLNYTPCLYQEHTSLYRSVKANISFNKRPYQLIISTKKIHSLTPMFFHASRSISTKAYLSNYSADSDNTRMLKTYNLDNISSNGTLCSRNFRVDLSQYNISNDLAISPKGIFYYDPIYQRLKFEQTSLFTHAEDYTKWIFANLENLKTWEGKQLSIVLYEKYDDDGYNNGAVYIPPYNEEVHPEIQMPRGDDIYLHNIRVDGEAVQHEINHHLVFKYLTTTTGQSLVLHEGLADILVQLQSKNFCLGEFLCPKTGICRSTKCLRSANNNLNITAADFPSQPRQAHQASQIISGTIWDLVDKTDDASYIEIANLTYKTVMLLSYNAGYEEFLQKLFTVDQASYNKKYCANLKDILTTRGFTSKYPSLDSITC